MSKDICIFQEKEIYHSAALKSINIFITFLIFPDSINMVVYFPHNITADWK